MHMRSCFALQVKMELMVERLDRERNAACAGMTRNRR